MTDDTYGPWTVHTPGKCPVPPGTLVQVQLRNQSQIVAEECAAGPENCWDWSEDGEEAIAYYRIAREVVWLVEEMLMPFSGVKVCVHWPVIDGQPDFTRQPKWEKV